MKNLLTWGIIGLVLFMVFSGVYSPELLSSEKISFTSFVKAVKSDQVAKINVSDKVINGQYQSGQLFVSTLPDINDKILSDLIDHNVDVTVKVVEPQNIFMQIFINWFPSIAFLAFWVWMIRQMQGGGRNPLSFGRSKAKAVSGDDNKTTFADVAGMDEAKKEVSELVDFLKNPLKFQKLGAKVPSGVLLVGPPGTGKTLLARAVAGEAGVKFFIISGSDFVEMFVGVGASRVRDMFASAKEQGPCIIFIDEIDAVARARGAGWGGGNDEREQTLNQLLVEMDGFEQDSSVIVMAATNRVDVLDPALLRPGRFDRHVYVSLPDIKGRKEILAVHVKKIKLASDVDLANIAKITVGYSGADLANLVNEAALLAAGKDKSDVNQDDFYNSHEKISMGASRESMLLSPEEKRLTAFHEAGHAIVSLLVEVHDPVYKVTIIPRGYALGVTMFLPEADRYSMSLLHLKCKLASMFGGRVAEELVVGNDNVTTGASNDIEKATEIAYNIVTKWGLHPDLGPIYYPSADDGARGFPSGGVREYSEITAQKIDKAVSDILHEAYTRARNILTENKAKLDLMAEALIQLETINEDQIASIMRGEDVLQKNDGVVD